MKQLTRLFIPICLETLFYMLCVKRVWYIVMCVLLTNEKTVICWLKKRINSE